MVCGSSEIRRSVSVLVSFSNALARVGWAVDRCTHMYARASSMWRQRREHSSPRRHPVTMVSHSSRPHSGSDHASASRAAASVALGGSGLVFRGLGAFANSAGLTDRYRHRTAFPSAPRMM
jgi:hypothetical protein